MWIVSRAICLVLCEAGGAVLAVAFSDGVLESRVEFHVEICRARWGFDGSFFFFVYRYRGTFVCVLFGKFRDVDGSKTKCLELC